MGRLMKFLLCAVFLVTLALAAPTIDHVALRAKFVEEINNTPNITWKASATGHRFAGLPIGSVKSLCGIKEGSKADLDARVASGEFELVKEDHPRFQGLEVPEAFDSEENWPQCAKVIGDIRDQSNCGCCRAFGGASAASDRLCISTNGTIAVPLSAEDVCFNSNMDGCDGGQISTPWDYVSRTGVVTGSQQKNP